MNEDTARDVARLLNEWDTVREFVSRPDAKSGMINLNWGYGGGLKIPAAPVLEIIDRLLDDIEAALVKHGVELGPRKR